MTDSSPNEIAPIIGRAQGLFLSEQTAQQAVSALAAAAKDAIPHALGAGVSLIEGHQPTSVGATDALVLEADNLQYELRNGPCLSAWSEGIATYVEDTETDQHWPLWSASAAKTGIRSCFSVPLQAGPQGIGAMKIYAAAPDAFTVQDQKVLAHLARSAAVLLGHIQGSDTPQRISDTFKETLRIRDLIATARGVIMERHGIEEDEAFNYLLSEAGNKGVSLHGFAKSVLRADTRKDTPTEA
ncbi:ANTAR domain-containing protein [Arthrobacter cheniae]|uniref:ANTAR domain-containing protein n=1 Tax=Arthrobacter cheniae TaxID=1258888 RepID=A0A3A5M757_9MICC|nr:GAF and ANTAR domain-containing protein [Arthrobacter cheniae]RJT74409.1 ANTAR domain-containing protein [Arthrobacter cheniae]